MSNVQLIIGGRQRPLRSLKSISTRINFVVYLLLTLCLIFAFSCQQEIHLGMSADELKFSRIWGDPQDKLKVTDTVEVWHYVIYDIDHIVFLRENKVVGQIRHGPQEEMWAITQRWVTHVKNNLIYQLMLDNYLDDIVNQRLRLGMIQTEASLSWGNPANIKRTQLRYGIREEWLYRRPIYQQTVLIFDNGILTDWGTIKE